MKKPLLTLLLLFLLLSCEKENDQPAPFTVMDLLEEQDDLSLFRQAIYEEGLEELVRSEPELTVFAVPDDKFPQSGFLIYNHIIKGKTLPIDSFPAYETLPFLTGSTNRVFVFDGRTMIEDAEIIEGDLFPDRGVVHMLDNSIAYHPHIERIIIDEKGLTQRIAGLYADTRDYLDYSFLLTALVSDDATSTLDQWAAIDAHTLNSYNREVGELWTKILRIESVAHLFLEEVNEARADKAVRERFSAEVKAIRALARFYFLNLWGELIIYDYENNRADGRKGVNEAYTSIISDLTGALDYLPEQNTGFDKLNSYSLHFFIAKVHVYQGEWELAKARLEKIINAREYSLSTTIEEGLSSPEELILGFPIQGYPYESVLVNLHSNTFHKGTNDLISRYAQNDQRLSKFIAPATQQIRKFYPQRMLPLLRYAEVLMLYAETLHELRNPKALEILNKIRQRAGLAAYEDLDSDALAEAIRQEKRREFAFEGNRFFDLKRTNQYLEVMQKKGEKVSEKDLLLPIPPDFINRFGSSYQNPGY